MMLRLLILEVKEDFVLNYNLIRIAEQIDFIPTKYSKPNQYQHEI